MAYSFISLDFPGAAKTQAQGISENGKIVGLYVDATGVTHSFLEQNNVFTTIDDPLGTNSSQFGNSVATGINNPGQIVGYYFDTAGLAHGFFDDKGTFSTLDDTVGANGTFAEGIAENGRIVGYYLDANNKAHGFVDDKGSFTAVDFTVSGVPAGSVQTFAFGINDPGRIVGYYLDSSNHAHGFLDDKGTFTTIDDPLAVGGTFVEGIPENGRMVGYYLDAGNHAHGFVDDKGTFITIDDPGATDTFAQGVNDEGQIVGYYIDASGHRHGFEADPNMPQQSPAVLTDCSWARGWGSPDNPRIITDVNGDGTSDYVGFGASFTFIAYGGTFSNGQGATGPGFSGVTAAVHDFGTAEGYTANVQRGAAPAGVGFGDILYGQGFAGVYWYAAIGETPQTDAAGNTYEVLQYQASPNFYGNFGSQQGWTQHNGFQILKASASDSYASILGFGNDGIVVGPQAFAPGASAASSYVMPFAAGNNSGWDQQVDIRSFTDQNGKVIDLNGDGIADFVGMGPQGLVFALGNHSGPGGGFGLGALQTAHVGAGGTADLGEVQGWNNAATLRDIVYDPLTGYDDIIAFGAAGVYVSMGQNPATHGGEPFGQLYLAMGDFGSNQGWSVGQTPRLVGDVTGDGTPDIVGFGANSTFVAVGSRDGSSNLSFKVDPTLTIGDFGSAEGWSGSNLQTLRALGTFPSTGGGSHSDLVLSGAFNTQVWQYT